jgi:phasin family protein
MVYILVDLYNLKINSGDFTMSNKNPFADLFSNFAGNCAFNDAFSFDKFIAAGRLNAKAFSDAAKAATEGVQALTRRQAEIAQKSSEEFARFFKDVSSSAKTPEAGIAKQAEFTKSSIESAIANSKELFEMAAKSGSEASDIIGKRVSSALSELAVNTNSAPKKNKNEAA